MKIDFEKVLAEYGLKVGDKVRIKFNKTNLSKNVYVIKCNNHCYYLNLIGANSLEALTPTCLINYEFEKVEPKKKVGEMLCAEFDCKKCPLHSLNCAYTSCPRIRTINEIYKGINEIYKGIFERYPELEPMRDYIEKKLNEEIEDD